MSHQEIGFCPPECGPPPCQSLLWGIKKPKQEEPTLLEKTEAELCYEVYNCIGTDLRTTFTKFDHKYDVLTTIGSFEHYLD